VAQNIIDKHNKNQRRPPMKRIPAGEKMCKELEELLNGVNNRGLLLSEFIKKELLLFFRNY